MVALNFLGFHPGKVTIKCLISYLDLLKILRFINNFSNVPRQVLQHKSLKYLLYKTFFFNIQSYLETLLIRLKNKLC
jgi:hypothetical protein